MASKTNTAVAVNFLDNIKLQCENDPSKYSDFLSIMKAYKKRRISNDEVVLRICELFNGYPSLIREFNSFLPPGYVLEPSSAREESEPYITLNTPEGVTVYPRDYAVRRMGRSPPPQYRPRPFDIEA
ncbi:paired amphipathic helix [Crepidotus variabilis]|uniref:Paired amphipathic helix n=1 Tax=Crepidotus variabilis TaxID=179855 RepID=A0A9P6JI99_9AGAR|nr:paired amphipathic helix [Crepidotus variabilis]